MELGKVIAFGLGLALSAPACAISQQPSTNMRKHPTIRAYTFPLGLPPDTLVCAETARGTGPMTGCITLKHLRDLTRDMAAD